MTTMSKAIDDHQIAISDLMVADELLDFAFECRDEAQIARAIRAHNAAEAALAAAERGITCARRKFRIRGERA